MEEHTSDIESVLRATNIQAFHLFTYSRGVSYALRFAQKQPSSILSLILGDYPPEHRKMSAEWAEDYIQHYLEPHHRLGHIRPEAVRAIQRESTQIALHEMMRFPVLVTKGMLEDSLISETDLQSYNEICTNLSIKCFQLSGHGIKMTEKELFYESIQDFLKRN
ncbi:hypothetical protein FHS14_000437 [Paenibacillus baekrokdamisoli]|nr:hypothetical protein [Paenibacillus baekrokdamisoli]